MTYQEFHEAYGTSVYKVRLQVAMSLLPLQGISHTQALEEADTFVHLLLKDSLRELREKFE